MGRPTPAHRLPATTSTHPEERRCRPTCQPDSSPRRTLTPPTLPHASNRLRTTLRFVAAIPCTPPAHHRTSLLWSPSSDFVPSQPHQLPANTIQSPYIHRANGLLQIAVSTLLRTGSIGPREGLFAEHCRYGTRDFQLIIWYCPDVTRQPVHWETGDSGTIAQCHETREQCPLRGSPLL